MASRSSQPQSSGDGAPALLPAGQHKGKPPLKLSRPVIMIGSERHCHLHLVSDQVSRHHAAIVNNEHGGSYIRDLASRTHTYVNGKRVREAVLKEGDDLRIGTFSFKFTYGKKDEDAGAVVPAAGAQLNVEGSELPVGIEGRLMLVGRRPVCDIPLLEESASQCHAIIYERDGERYLRDLGSRTGTLLNGQPIRQEKLSFGDVIRVGETEMRYAEIAVEGEASGSGLDELEHLVGTSRLGAEAVEQLTTAEREAARPIELPAADAEADDLIPMADSHAAMEAEEPAEIDLSSAAAVEPEVVEPGAESRIPLETASEEETADWLTESAEKASDESAAPELDISADIAAEQAARDSEILPSEEKLSEVAPEADLQHAGDVGVTDDAENSSGAVPVAGRGWRALPSEPQVPAIEPPAEAAAEATPAQPPAEGSDPDVFILADADQSQDESTLVDDAPMEEAAPELRLDLGMADAPTPEISADEPTEAPLRFDLADEINEPAAPVESAEAPASEEPAEMDSADAEAPEADSAEVDTSVPIEEPSKGRKTKKPAKRVTKTTKPASSSAKSRKKRPTKPVLRTVEEMAPEDAAVEAAGEPAEVLENTEPTPESALDLHDDSIGLGEEAIGFLPHPAEPETTGPGTVDVESVSDMSDTTFGRAVSDFSADSPEPIVESATDENAESTTVDSTIDLSATSNLSFDVDTDADTEPGVVREEVQGIEVVEPEAAQEPDVIDIALDDDSPLVTGAADSVSGEEIEFGGEPAKPLFDLGLQTPSGTIALRSSEIVEVDDASSSTDSRPEESPAGVEEIALDALQDASEQDQVHVAAPEDAAGEPSEMVGATTADEADGEMIGEAGAESEQGFVINATAAGAEDIGEVGDVAGIGAEPSEELEQPAESSATFASAAVTPAVENESEVEGAGSELPSEPAHRLAPAGAPQEDDLLLPPDEATAPPPVPGAIGVWGMGVNQEAHFGGLPLQLNELPPAPPSFGKVSVTFGERGLGRDGGPIIPMEDEENDEPAAKAAPSPVRPAVPARPAGQTVQPPPPARQIRRPERPAARADNPFDLSPEDVGAADQATVPPFTGPGSATFGQVTTAFDGLAMPPVREVDVFSQMGAPPADDAMFGERAGRKSELEIPAATADWASDRKRPKRHPEHDESARVIEEIETPLHPDSLEEDDSTEGGFAPAPLEETESSQPPGEGRTDAARRMSDATRSLPRPPRRSIGIKPLLVFMLISMGVAVGAIWQFVPVKSLVEGSLRFGNFDKQPVLEQRRIEASQKALLASEQVMTGAKTALVQKHPEMGPGWLGNVVTYSRVVDGAKWSQARPGVLLLPYEGRDETGDPARIEAIVQALYNANSHYAEEAARNKQAAAETSDEVARLQRRSDDLQAQLDALRRIGQAQPAPQQVSDLQDEVGKLETTWNESVAKLKSLQFEVDGMTAIAGATAAPGNAKTATEPAADAQLQQMQNDLDSAMARITTARATAKQQADQARKSLEAMIGQFQQQVTAAQGVMNQSPELAAYVTAAQKLQDDARRLTDDLIHRQQQTYARLSELKARLNDKMMARREDLWKADPQLKDYGDRLALLTRQYNAAVGSGMDKEAGDLKADLDLTKKMIDARQTVLGNDAFYTDAMNEIQSLIDATQRQIDDDRRNTDRMLADSEKAFLSAAPHVEKLPGEQKEVAAELERRLSELNAARSQYAAAMEQAAVQSNVGVQAMEQEASTVRAKMDSRRKELAAAHDKTLSDEQAAARAKSLAAKQQDLSDAKEEEAEARKAFFSRQKEFRAMQALVTDARSATEKLDGLMRDKDTTEKALADALDRLEEKKKAADRSVLPAPPDERSVTVTSLKDSRATYAVGSCLIIPAIFVGLILLVGGGSHAHAVPTASLAGTNGNGHHNGNGHADENGAEPIADGPKKPRSDRKPVSV